MTDKEIWKAVEGFEDIYEVSNHGRVRSLDRDIWIAPNERQNGYYIHYPSKLLKPCKNSAYRNSQPRTHVYLTLNCKRASYSVAQLVANAFLQKNSPEDSIVMHKDGNPENNHVDNLYWTIDKSVLDIHRRDCSKSVKCVETGEVFKTITDAAKAFNCTISNVSRNLRGLTKHCRKHHFEYV